MGRNEEKSDVQIWVEHPAEKVFETCGQGKQHGIRSEQRVEERDGKQIKVVWSEREETTNLAEEVEEEIMLLMMGYSSGDEHK